MRRVSSLAGADVDGAAVDLADNALLATALAVRLAGHEVGRRVDESSPMVDARMPNGSRFNAIIPPLALDGAVITIR